MLHELHIFGSLPAAVVEEALRGLSAEPIYDDSGRFDRFRNRPTQGLRSFHPDGVQPSYPPDSVQNLPPAGVRSGSPDNMPIRRPDDARSGWLDGAERWPADGVQRYPSGCVQNHPPAGVGSGSPDSMPIRRPDDARRGQLDSAERWPADGVQRYPSDGVQNRLPAGVGSESLDSMPIRRPDDARRGQPDSAERWPADGVQSWRIRGLGGAEERRRLLGALLVPVREARATALLRAVGSEIRGAAFDLEGTLTELEFVDALAGRLGFGERMQTRTRASMTGRTLDFRRDYEDRMAALRGVEVAVMEEVIGSMTLAPGVDALCERLHAAAIPVAVISGGCSRLGEAVRKKIAARALYATVWEEHAARFTGHAASPVVDPAGKLRALEDFARTTACPLGNMAAAGDGANDLEMLSAAGTALLTHATARPAWPEILAALL